VRSGANNRLQNGFSPAVQIFFFTQLDYVEVFEKKIVVSRLLVLPSLVDKPDAI